MKFLAAYRARRRASRLARQRRGAERALTDAVYDLDKWSFADRPSEKEDRVERIHALIRKVEALGGDAERCVEDGTQSSWSKTYLLNESMPETFEHVRDPGGNRWVTRRIDRGGEVSVRSEGGGRT